MIKDLTFESACNIVKGEHPELAQDIDVLLNLALTTGMAAIAIPITIASGVTALTPALVILTSIGALSNLFGVKNEVFKVGTSIISKMASKRDQNAHELYIRMQQAYTLTCYTAFFDTLASHEQLAPLLKKIKMKHEERMTTIITVCRDLWYDSSTVMDDNEVPQGKLAMLQYAIAMPQPGDTFEMQRQHLAPLYEQLAKRIMVFFELETIKSPVQSEQEKIKQAVSELPKKALDTFIVQYNTLAMKFPEFAVWLNLQKDDKIIQLSKQSKQLLESIAQVEQRQTDVVLRSLANHYKSMVDAPIINDPDSGLIYPRKRDIFIPQSFKVTHYKKPEQLKESFWKDLPERQDLEVFLSAYFNHEEASTKTPLIILGQPGSGKSLLTSMIAAQLITLPFTPLRVELRHINAEDPISVQIEGQIRGDTDRNFDWTTLRDHAVDGPVLVIFDGYDELLQATSNLFSGYLNQVREFQNRQLDQSVRAVVTSRFTLIDKAVIPPGSTIIRLLEFDEERQNRWIDKWNIINTIYFQQNHTEPFKLPQDYENIKRLAEQPLLLMMLAIYDANGNPLSKAASDLDQSLLYDKLLRRFIERELQKDEESARSWREEELDEAIDHEMERLGVAAIGMFNRRTVSIRAEELNADLKFFDLEQSSLETLRHDYRTAIRQTRRPLLPSEKLFGSFFFQRLEAARRTEEVTKGRDRNIPARLDDTAYEFLHNTFGEFLTADFMQRKILEETRRIRRDQTDRNKKFSRSMTSRIDLANFDETWYARFMYAPLFSRPVVLKLLREWSQYCLKKEDRDTREFLEDFDTIITSHINILLSDKDLPILMTSDLRPFAALATIGYIAIYTLNLILLRTFFDQSADGYMFDETNYVSSEDSVRVWDRLTYLWRSWFSLETLKELAAILEVDRDGTKLHLSIKKGLDSRSSIDHLNLVHSVSQSLADNITAGLSGLLLHDAFVDDKVELGTIVNQLKAEKLDRSLEAYLFTKQLRHLQRQSPIRQEDALKIFKEAASNSSLQLNHEDAASLFAEMSNILNYLVQDMGLKIELDAYDYARIAPILEGLEAFKLAGILKTRFVEDWFVRGEWLEAIGVGVPVVTSEAILNSSRNAALLVELIHFLLKMNLWSIPIYLNLELINQLIVHNNVLPMRLAAIIIKLTRETGNQEITDFIYQHYLKNIETSGVLVSIDLAIELVKLARERGDRNKLNYFINIVLKNLQEEDNINVELTFEVLKFAREIGNQQALTRFVKIYLEASLDFRKPSRFTGIFQEINTDSRKLPAFLTIELLKIAYEIDNQQIFKLLIVYINQLLSRMKFIQPELALEILKFMSKMKEQDQEAFDNFKGQYLANMLQSQNLVSVELAVGLIKLALGSKQYNIAIIEKFYRKNITLERCYLGLLPIDTIVDLRELAQTFGDNLLLRKINERLKL